MTDSSPKRVAIVTGAAQGIGRAIALRLASDGLAVAVNDLPSKKAQLDEVVGLIEQKNVRGLAVPADVSNEEEVRGTGRSQIAQELDKHGITVNSYAPGIIETPMTVLPTDERLGGPTASLKKFLGLPNAKTGQPDAIASLVSYLASPEAHFINGQTINADGGILFD